MSDKGSQKSRWPRTDYRAAIARAVEWLGDRYLLAKPVSARSDIANTRAVLVRREPRYAASDSPESVHWIVT